MALGERTYRDYTEKRDFIRMGLDCEVQCTALADGTGFTGRARDLSACGIALWAERDCPVGTRLEIRIEPRLSVVPPLHAVVEVVRATVEEGGWRVAASIVEIHS